MRQLEVLTARTRRWAVVSCHARRPKMKLEFFGLQPSTAAAHRPTIRQTVDVKRRSLIELNTAVVLWAGTALFAKWIPLPAHQITGLRSVVAAGALLVLLAARRDSLGVRGLRDLGLLIGSGMALAAHWVTYFQSIQTSTVAIGILSLHAYPIMTALDAP